MPHVQWKTFTEDDVVHAAMFEKNDSVDGSFGTIYINTSFPLFRNEFKFWIEEYPRADQDEVVAVIKQVYEDELVSKLMHAYKLKGQELEVDEEGNRIRVKDENIKSWISSEALTAATLGLVNVEQRIKATAASRFGGARKNAKEVTKSRR